MSPWLCSALTGLVAGAHSSIWGMYKDAPHEGFTLRVFLRSMVFGTLVALLISRVTGLFPVDAAGSACCWAWPTSASWC